MASEARRHVALRELDRRRSTLAQALRGVTKKIEDAEFVELEPPQRPQVEPSEPMDDVATDTEESEENYPNSEAAE